MVCKSNEAHYLKRAFEHYHPDIYIVEKTLTQLAAPTSPSQSAQDAMLHTAHRLAFLCRQSRSRNFQETVLAGASEELRDLVLEVYREILEDPTALLGHKGRNYIWNGQT